MTWNDSRRTSAVLSTIFLLGMVAAVGCGGPSFTQERFQQIDSGSTIEQVESTLGQGEEVKNTYTDEQIELHELPADTTFLRWNDLDDPNAVSYVGFSGGTMVHRTTHHTE